MPDAPYITVDEVRELIPDLVADDARIEGLIAQFEGLTERYRGVAFTPRTATVDVYLDCSALIDLGRPMIRSVTSVELDGDAFTGYRLDKPAGQISLGCRHTGEATVEFSHGYDQPDPLLVETTALWVSLTVSQRGSGTSRDILGQNMDGSWIRYSTPDWGRGRPTGWSEVDLNLNTFPDFRRPGVA